MTDINYQEALRILGLKGQPSDAELRKAYISLAKKWHPDVNRSAEALEKFKRISLAKGVIQGGVGTVLSFADFRSEYDEIKNFLRPATTSFNELQDVEVRLVKKYGSDAGKVKRIKLAKNVIIDEINIRLNLRKRIRGKIIGRTRMNLRSQEDKNAAIIQKMNQKLMFDQGVKELKSKVHKRLHKVTRTAKVRSSKAHVPLLGKLNGKKVIRFALISAGVLAAIAGGKYLYDHRQKVFKPAGLIEQKKHVPFTKVADWFTFKMEKGKGPSDVILTKDWFTLFENPVTAKKVLTEDFFKFESRTDPKTAKTLVEQDWFSLTSDVGVKK
jgi:hypothetical protein